MLQVMGLSILSAHLQVSLHWRKTPGCCFHLQSVKDVEEAPSTSGEAQPPSLPQYTPENYSQVRRWVCLHINI